MNSSNTKISKLILSLLLIPTFSQPMEQSAQKNEDQGNKKTWVQFIYNHPYMTSLAGYTAYNSFNSFMKKKNETQESSSASHASMKSELIESADYHKILGISDNATKDEIKKAYQQKVKQYHPDRNPGDKNAASKMQEINEAYKKLYRGDVLQKTGPSYSFKGYKTTLRPDKLPLWSLLAMYGGLVLAGPIIKVVLGGLGIKYVSHEVLVHKNEKHDHSGWFFKCPPEKQNLAKK